jgi:xanthine dehydrogenase YagR molybdenum-binding subunit
VSAVLQDIQPAADPGSGPVAKGDPVSRVDGRVKVTGRARYAAEHAVPGMAHGVVIGSSIARGRIAAMQLDEALAVPGVLVILSHLNRPKVRNLDIFHKDISAPGGKLFKPLYSSRVLYSGQPVALVLAENLEAATHAASLVQVSYSVEPHETELLPGLDRAREARFSKCGFTPPPAPLGDADAAFAAAGVQVDASFHHAAEHHNPIEPHATTVLRGENGHLTIYDKTQGSQNSREMISQAFGLTKRNLTVRNPFVGGAFGSGLRPQYNLTLAVMAALQLKRSVRVELTREQMFTFGHRPETWQRIRLAAAPDGTLTAVIHEAVTETSRLEDHVEVVVNWAAQLYRCDNLRFDYKLLPLDRHSPADMRAPGAAQGLHALEVAMDELSYRLGLCPLELRLRNYADKDSAGLPFSSKELRACYEQGAARFGWSARAPLPRARREGHELVGWGMATGIWDAPQMFARCRAVFHDDGRLEISSATSDVGTGTYTVMTQIAAATMGLPLEQVTFHLGDSNLPVAPVQGGSATVATVGSAVEGVCEKLQKKLLELAGDMPGSGFSRVRLEEVEFVGGEMRLCNAPGTAISLKAILAAYHGNSIEEKYLLLPNLLKQQKYVRAAHSAVFCEVRVDEDFGTVRVTRVVSAIAAGQIINGKTARSQVIGGVVWGIGQALHEESLSDPALGRFMNRNFDAYQVPVNADIGEVEVIFVDEDDRIVSKLGAKGVGEIGMVGVSAAVCNAIYHATGRRVCSTPMRPDKVMAP